MKWYSFGSAFCYSAYYLWDSSILLSDSFLIIIVQYPIVRTLALTVEEPLLDGILLSGYLVMDSELPLSSACLLHFSCVQSFVTLWTVAHQAPLAMGFSRQEYWNGLSLPTAGDLPNPGIKPTSLTSSELAGGFFTTSTTWEASFWLLF